MIRIYSVLAILSLCLSPLASASWISPKGMGACVKNLNPWGHSSRCQCLAEEARYQEEIGQCVIGEAYPILVSGVLESKDAARQGVYLKSELGRFQLIVSLDQLEKLQRANGLYFEVEGQFLLRPKAQPNARATIIVERLSWLE